MFACVSLVFDSPGKGGEISERKCTLSSKNLTFCDTSSVITCRGPWYSVAYCKSLACVLHNLVLLRWRKNGWRRVVVVGGGGDNATVITNKKHLSHLCNLFSFNMRSMLEICEFWGKPWRRDQSTLSLLIPFFLLRFRQGFGVAITHNLSNEMPNSKWNCSELNLWKVWNIRKLCCGFVSVLFSKCTWLSGVLE